MHIRYRETFAAAWSTLEKRLLPSYVWTSDPLTFWRERILFLICFIATVFGPIALVPSLLLAYSEGLWIVIIVDSLAYMAAVTILIARNASFVVRALVICFILYALGVCILFILGPVGAGYIWLFGASVLISTFIGLGAAIWTLVFNTIVMLSVGIFIAYGNPAWILHMDNALGKWLVMSTNFLLLNAFVAITTAFILNGLKTAIIMEQKISKSLRENDDKFRTIFDKASEGILIADAITKKFLQGNATICSMLGYTKEEIESLTVSDIHPPKDISHILDEFEKQVKGEKALAEGLPVLRKDRSIFYADIGTSTVIIGGVHYLVGIFRDITERKRAEEALQESEHKYKSLIDNFQDIILTFNLEGKITFASRNIKEKLGYDSAETINMNILDFIQEEDHQRVMESLQKGMKGEKIKGFQTQIITKSGERLSFESSFSRVYKDEVVVGAQAIVKDITERKRAEEALRQGEEKYRTILESIEDGYYEVDLAGNLTFFNDSMCRILGYPPEEMMGMNNQQYTDKDYAKRLYEMFAEVYRTGESSKGADWQIIRKDGTKRIGEIFTSLQKDSSGNPIGFRGIARDITERKRAEAELQKSEEQFRRIFNEGPFGMGLESPDHTIIAANKVLCELLGYTEQELAGQNIVDITYEEDKEKSKELLGQLFANSSPVLRLEKRYVKKDGNILWANTTISAVHGQEGNVLYGLAIIEDLTESRKAAEKIHLLAYYDSLTGLPNRTFHKELMIRAIEHAERRKEIFALIYIGLDNFQRINDSLGYSTGDLLLKAVADRLTNSLRKSDLVARSDKGETVSVVSRVGGDEFIVLAHDLNQAQDAAKTSRRLLEEMSAPYDISGREVFLTVSIGIALYPDDGTDVDDLLKNAEKAMRHTKSEGKNNFHFYSSSMHTSVLAVLIMESDLHKALERNEFVLYYQPQVDTATRMVKGMEALIRWIHPDKGLIPPMQFIPLAETSGLIIPIGEFVIRTVCRQIKTWQEAGYKQINISLNVSGRQFDQQNLIEIVKDALQDTMISPQCLELEITESTIMRNPEKALRILTELKATGIGISIDDFGTGYSSLSYLKRLPLDFLKIDQSFVKSLASDSRDQAIVRATIAMAHSLNLKTIAEGVETEAQLSFLQEHGCDEIQGYFFSRPLPAEEIPGILAKGYL